jgi:hypothetical protein
MTDDQLRTYAKRLERYAVRSRESLWKGRYSDALPNLAETAEIARRLYSMIQQQLITSAPDPATTPTTPITSITPITPPHTTL